MSEEIFYYAATVAGNSLSRSKNKNTPSVKLKFRLLYELSDPDTPLKQVLYHDLWLTYKCAKSTVNVLKKVFDWKGHNITDFNEPILFGKKCQLACEYDEWEGEKRLKVKFINKLGDMHSLDPEELNDLSNEVQGYINEELGIKNPVDVPDGDGSCEKGLPF